MLSEWMLLSVTRGKTVHMEPKGGDAELMRLKHLSIKEKLVCEKSTANKTQFTWAMLHIEIGTSELEMLLGATGIFSCPEFNGNEMDSKHTVPKKSINKLI